MAFFEDVWSRNFLNIFATPLSISEYVAGWCSRASRPARSAWSSCWCWPRPLSALSFLGYGLMLVPFFLVLFLFGIALGIVASAMVLRLGPASEWFIWPIPALMSPFAGVFYPLVDPAALDADASRTCCRPRTCFEGMRAIVSGRRFPCRARALARWLWPSSTSCWPAGSSPACIGTRCAPG